MYRDEVGLVIDIPKACGYGISNDENTARRFFKNAEIASDISGLAQSFIHKLFVNISTF